jgi:transcriptional regulator with XRE-family HTH domain
MENDLTIQQKKDYARMLYLRERLTQKEIAQKTGVSAVTVNKWINAEKWESLKTSLSITREEQLSNLYRQVAAINECIAGRDEGARFATSREADIINKLAAAIEKMERETGVAEIISVSKQVLDFIRRTDPEKARELSYCFDAYVKEKLR